MIIYDESGIFVALLRQCVKVCDCVVECGLGELTRVESRRRTPRSLGQGQVLVPELKILSEL